MKTVVKYRERYYNSNIYIKKQIKFNEYFLILDLGGGEKFLRFTDGSYEHAKSVFRFMIKDIFDLDLARRHFSAI